MTIVGVILVAVGTAFLIATMNAFLAEGRDIPRGDLWPLGLIFGSASTLLIALGVAFL